MQLFSSLVLALSVAISFVSPSLSHAHQARRHHVHRQDELARRDPGDVTLYKRFDNARFTYYAVGLGACGQTNVPSDYVVALDSAQYDSGSYCFQMITITANGKTAQAQIVDRCPGCPEGGLDFSQGLFEFFADISAGVLTGSWNLGSGAAPSPSPSPSPSPTPTSVYIPLTTLIPTPTSTSQPPPTTTSASHITSSASSSSNTVSSNSTSSAPSQTTTNPVAVSAGPIPGGASDTSALYDVNLSLVYIGQFLGACNSQ